MEKALSCAIILVILLLVYIMLCKIYISMLMATGLSKSVARFQVFSLFIGCGYTSAEAELVMYNKTRKKIALATMITGFIFATLFTGLLVGVVAGLNFNDTEAGSEYIRNLLITLGITLVIFVAVLLITKIPALKRWFYGLIEKIIDKKLKNGNSIIYEEHFYNKYLAEIYLIKIPKILVGTRLGDINFKKVGLTILLVYNEKNKLMTTDVDDIVLQVGDTLEVYGDPKIIERIFANKEE